MTFETFLGEVWGFLTAIFPWVAGVAVVLFILWLVFFIFVGRRVVKTFREVDKGFAEHDRNRRF